MRNTLLIAAFGLALATPALAQDVETQNPPSPNSSESEPEPAGSVPPGAGTATEKLPGDALGRAATTPPAATTAPVQR